MKKFLSMLLALTVVFTYTFGAAGSVFADVNSDAADAVKIIENLTPVYPGSASDDNGKYVNVNGYEKHTAEADVPADGSTQLKIDRLGQYVAISSGETIKKGEVYYTATTDKYKIYTAQLDAFTADAKADAIADVYAEAKETSPNFTTGVITTAAQLGAYIMAHYGDKAACAQVALDKEQLVANAGLAATADYTTKDEITEIAIGKTTYTKKSSKEVADLIVEETVNTIKDYDLSAVKTISTAKTAKTAMEKIFSEAVSGTGAYNNPYTLRKNAKFRAYNFTSLEYETKEAALKTTTDFALEDATESADIATYKANLAKAIVATKKTPSYANDSASWNAYLDAYNTAMTWMIENAKVEYKNVDAVIDSLPVNNLIDNVYVASRYITLADSLLANADYDANTVKAQLKAKLTTLYTFESDLKTYSLDKETYNPNYFTAKTALSETVKVAKKAEVSAKIDTKEIDKVEYNTYDSKAYYALEWDAVKAAVDAYNAAVDAAKTSDDLTAADNALKVAIKAIDTKSVVDGYYTAGKLATTYNAEMTKLNNYKAYLEGVAAANKDKLVITETVDHVWYASKNARSVAEIKALYAEAQAVYDTNKTVSAWKAEAKKVVDMINALPAKVAITTADKEAIAAAYKAYDEITAEYKVYVSNVSTLNAAVNAVKAKEVEAIYNAAKTIPTVTTVKVADKATVKAYYDMMDAFNKTEMYNAPTQYNLTSTQAVLDKIEKIELANVTDLINALPAPIKLTLNDKEAVKAARAAYDAFVAEYAKDYNADVKALATSHEPVLIAAEAAITALEKADEELNKYTDKDAKADLLDMNRKITIWRTSKKSIRVTAVGSVSNIKENGYTVKYTFYKKAPGAKAFKAVKTTTSNKYTYTNLKKGYNKFQVKVKVYDAEGKFVASKTTFYRAAKVK